jgi:hypothetical protein
MEGFKKFSSETERLKISLDSVNIRILNDIKIIQNNDKSKINVINIKNNIDYYNTNIFGLKSSINKLNSNDINNYYNVVNSNLNILKTIYFNLQNNIISKPILPTISTATATVTATATATANIPNTIPTNKIVYKNKNMITSNDISKLCNTIEGFNLSEEQFTDYISSYNINMPIIEGLNDKLNDDDMTNITTLMTKEKELLDRLADFNKKYERYIHCNDSNVNSDCELGNYPNSKELIDKMDTINGIIDKMKGKTISQTTDYHDSIVRDYDNVTKLRNDLDIKLKQLYDPENSKIVDFKYSYDSTIYSGILISALATSLLYYIFTEL